MSKNFFPNKNMYGSGLGFIFFGAPMSIIFFCVGFVSNLDRSQPSLGLFYGMSLLGVIFVVVGAILAVIARVGPDKLGVYLENPLAPNTQKRKEAKERAEQLFQAKDEVKIEQVIKVRCQNCNELNDEDAAFCKKCRKNMV